MSAPTYPTSGTTAFNLDLATLCEEAYERCGIELRSGYEMRTARRSLSLMLLDWSNRGINLWTVDGPYSVTLVPGTATYNLPVDTVDLLDHVIRTGAGNTATQTDLSITRISESTYITIPNKLTQGRPIQVWINRQGGANNTAMGGTNPPTFTVWPIPDSSTSWVFVYYRLRRIQDAGTGINGQDIPYRFLPVLCAGLAYYISIKVPMPPQEAMMRIPMLKAQYDEAWDAASTEDREKASIRLVPRMSFSR
jgi:hypothetical protein